MPDMTDPSAIYNIVLFLHVAAAIVGFGGVIAHGAYNAKAFAGTAGDASVLLKTTDQVASLAFNAMIGVLPLGIVLVAVSEGEISFGAPWISASFVTWFAMIGLSHGMVRKAARGLKELADNMAPDAIMSESPEVMTLAKKLATGEGLVQLLLVITLVLMVFQFGG